MKNPLLITSSFTACFRQCLLGVGAMLVSMTMGQAATTYTWTGGTGSWETTTNWSPSTNYAGSAITDNFIFGPTTTGGTITATLGANGDGGGGVYELNNFTYAIPSTSTTNFLVQSSAVNSNQLKIDGTLLMTNANTGGAALTFTDSSTAKNLTLTIGNLTLTNGSTTAETLNLGNSNVGIKSVSVTGTTILSSDGVAGHSGAIMKLHLDPTAGGTANLGILQFGTAGQTASGNNSVYLDQNSTVNTDSEAVTVSGIQTAYNSGGTVFTTGSNAIYAGIGSRPGYSNTTLTINNSSNYVTGATLNDLPGAATLSSNLSLVKTGSGIQTLSGASTYTGTTTINGGTLQLGSSTALGGGGNGTTVNGGVITGSTAVGGFQTVSATTINTSGTLDLNGQTITNPLVLSGGSLINSNATAAKVTNGVAGITFSGSSTTLSTASIPTVSITGGGGSGAAANALLGLTINSITFSGATGFKTGDLITVAGSMINASYRINATGGVITSLTLLNPGLGITGTPTISYLADGGGTGSAAAFTFNNNTLQVAGIQTTATGTGYTSAPTVSITGITTTTPVLTSIALTSSTNSSVGGAGNITLAGVVNGAGALTKVGAATLTLTGANTYSGGTTVNAGTLTIGTGGTLGASTGPLVVSNPNNTGAGTAVVLNLATAVDTITGSLSGAISLPTSGTNTATINNGGVGRNFTVNQSTSGTFAGVIAGSGSFTLGSLSTSTLTLSGTNTYTGATTITAGTLQVNGSLASGSTVGVGTAGTLSGSGTVNGNATLAGSGIINFGSTGNIAGTLDVTGGNWNGTGSVGGAVSAISGTFNIGSGANLTATNGLAVSGTGSLSGTGTVTGSVNYTSGTNSSFGGVIAGSGKTLTMNSATTTLTLGGTNTYTGATTVSAGTLQVNGALASGSAVGVSGSSSFLNGSGTTGAVTVSSGGTVGGTLQTAGLTVQNGGIISPGNSPGILTSTAGATFLTGGSYILQVNNDGGTGSAGTNWDQLALTGSLDISSLTSSTTFTLTLQSLTALNTPGSLASFNESANHTWSSVITTTTGFSGAFNSNLFTINSVDFTNPFTGTFTLAQNGLNVDLIYTALVPEPSTWAMMLGGLALLVVIQRRRHKVD